MNTRFKHKAQFLSHSLPAQAGLAVMFNIAIAVLLTLVIPKAQFWGVLLVSQCIGLSVFFSFVIFNHFMSLHGLRKLIPLVIGAVVGVFLGLVASALSHGMELGAINKLIQDHIDQLLTNLFLAFFFGLIVMYFYFSREKQYQTSQVLQKVQINNLDSKKQVVETQLQLLQAQIEPHFLFNSLSNVISLIENDPGRAKLMLESLTKYLRSSLGRSHDRDGTLRDEIDLIENYLKIIQIRMEQRLNYEIHIEEKSLNIKFPIMLIQPLVENAILHGLEPLPEGGCIKIGAELKEGKLHIYVSDDGVGIGDSNLKGFGLLNVRQRLQSLYGESASLVLDANYPRGVRACVEIPYD